jgi:4-amino-4-deoxy-L-arabinose transferase-like glycosyltransferase
MAVSEQKLAGILSAAAVILFIAINFASLWTGGLRIRDEFATLDRSYSFHVRGDYSVVYSENQPSFRKPPLQYWMSAGLLNAGLPPLFSVRLPSFVFAILLIVCTGWLTYVLFPQQPLAAAAAVAMMACNARLLESAKTAMLDTGMAFFSAVAMIACVLAIKNPRWWYLVAVACGLGALQKAPVAFVMIAIAVLALSVAQRFQLAELREFRFERHFWRAAILMFAIVLAWPLMQWAFFGFEALREAYYVQVMQRFTPVADSDLSRAVWHHYILDSDRVFRIPAIIAMCVVAFVLKRRELLIFALLLGLYTIAAIFTKGHIYSRYSIVFLPFMAAGLAICIFHLARTRWLAAAVVLLFCAQNIFILRQRDFVPDTTTIAALEKFRSNMAESGSIILCDWKAGKLARVPPGMFSFYASGGHPFFSPQSPEDFAMFYSSGLIGPKLQGFCTQEQLKTIEQYLQNATTIDQYGPYIHWRAG